jgi:hypothetical protein
MSLLVHPINGHRRFALRVPQSFDHMTFDDMTSDSMTKDGA